MLLRSVLSALVGCALTPCLLAQHSALVPHTLAGRAGLERSWYTFAQTRLGDHLRHVTVHVSPTRTFTVFELSYAGGRTSFTERDLNEFGESIGVDEAQRLAELKEHELAARGRDPKLEVKQIPEIILFAQTAQGGLQAIDGETGRTMWDVQVGVPGHPSQPISATDQQVVAINGSYLYVFDQQSGRPLWHRPIHGVPTAGAALGRGLIYVPTLNGMIEAYHDDGTEARFRSLRSTGRIFHAPTAALGGISWTTDRGYIYFANAGEPGLRFRWEGPGTTTSRTAFAPPGNVLAGSTDGYVYAINQKRGDVLWRFSSGEPISEAPIAIDDCVYAATDSDTLFCLEAETGEQRWQVPRVHRVITVSADRVYGLDVTARLVVLDRTTGGYVSGLTALGSDVPVVNTLTDRIYLASSHGLLQCLHEQSRVWPLTRAVPEPSEEETEEAPIEADQPSKSGPARQPPPQPGSPSAEPPPADVNPFADEVDAAADELPEDVEVPADEPAEPSEADEPADPFADPFEDVF